MTVRRTTTGILLAVFIMLSLPSLAYMQEASNSILIMTPSLDRTLFATLHDDDTSHLQVWDAATLRVLNTILLPSKLWFNSQDNFFLREIAFDPTNERVALGLNSFRNVGLISIVNISTGSVIAELPGDEMVVALAWSPDGTRLASFGTRGLEMAASRSLNVWNTVDYTLVNTIPVTGGGTALTWNVTGDRLASANGVGGTTVWDAISLQEIFSLEHSETENIISSVAWSPDNSLIATTGTDSTIRIWNADTGVQVAFLVKADVPDFQHLLQWNTDGSQIASAAGPIIEVWEVASETRILSTDVGQYLRGISWQPDGSIIYAIDTIEVLTVEPTQTSDPA